MASVFETLNAVDVSGKIEKKNGLSYLSWAWAWAEVKKVVPDATYTVYERETEYGPCPYYTDGKTCWVKTGVTLNGLEHVEMLPVMDVRNRSVPLEAITSMDVNKTIQRSLTKCCARHGMGLYVYQGEDLPEETAQEVGKKKLSALEAKVAKAAGKPKKADPLPSSTEAMELREMMDRDGITEEGLQKYVAGKGVYPADRPVGEYEVSFINGFLKPNWAAIAQKIKSDPDYVPF